MGVERIAVIAQVENDAVAVGFIQWDVGGVIARRLLGLSVDDGNHEGICNRQNRLTKDGVAFELFARAGIDPSAIIHLFPIDRVALCDPRAAVYRQGRPGMTNGVATGVRRNVARSAERRTDQHNRPAIDRGFAAAFLKLLVAGGAALTRREMRCSARRNFSAGSKRDVEKKQRPGAPGERPCGIALPGGLEAPGNSGSVEVCSVAPSLITSTFSTVISALEGYSYPVHKPGEPARPNP